MYNTSMYNNASLKYFIRAAEYWLWGLIVLYQVTDTWHYNLLHKKTTQQKNTCVLIKQPTSLHLMLLNSQCSVWYGEHIKSFVASCSNDTDSRPGLFEFWYSNGNQCRRQKIEHSSFGLVFCHFYHSNNALVWYSDHPCSLHCYVTVW